MSEDQRMFLTCRDESLIFSSWHSPSRSMSCKQKIAVVLYEGGFEAGMHAPFQGDHGVWGSSFVAR